jgi:hypothetical protein
MRVHDSDAAVLYRKNPEHYAAFAPQAAIYPEYVWPRDINPHHPEQAVALDALAATIAAEQAVVAAAKDRKKQAAALKKQEAAKNRKRNRAAAAPASRLPAAKRVRQV